MRPLELSAEEWAMLKQLWFDLADSTATERDAALHDPAVPEVVRQEFERMLACGAADDARFEHPAHLASFGVAPSMPGRRLGPFIVRRLIARGGMGAVYEAERADEAYTQRVAIKTLWRGADSDVLMQRFRSERQILAGLQHPNISQLVDGGSTAEGTPWLAMEYVDGQPIDVWCDARQLGLSARLDLFRQVCGAVQHAHQRLVVHRDLKPGNIFVNDAGTVKLLDFGVAKLVENSDASGTLTEAGLSPFTAAYAAPEQVSGGEVSTATDIYALGAVLCTLLAGAPPHDLPTTAGIMDRLATVRDGQPRLPSEIVRHQDVAVARARGMVSNERLRHTLRGDLDSIVQMALRRDPTRRYASADAISDDVLRHLRRDRVLARPDTAGYRAWSFVRRHRAMVASAVLITATVLFTALLALFQASRIRDEAARSERSAAFLAGIVSGANVTSAEPIVRLSPQGTLAQLLDSALLRVPTSFRDDPRMRARLYAAIGANIMSQGRLAKAREVLDSARMLSASAYGLRSTEYARANLEYAALEVELDGPLAADEPLTIVEGMMRRSSSLNRDLAASVQLVRAAQAVSMGEMHRADSLAMLVITHEAADGARTQRSVRAASIRMAASSWLRRDPRDYLQRARGVVELADSLGLVHTLDQLRARAAEIEALLVLGRGEQASTLAAAWGVQLRQATSMAPSIEAMIAHTQAFVAAVQGDTAARHRYASKAWEIAQYSPDIAINSRLLIGNSAVDDALARGDGVQARRIAESSARALESSRSPLLLSYAELYVGLGRLAAGDAIGAESALRSGLKYLDAAPDLSSMGPRLRRVLVDALRQQGRVEEADRLSSVDPPRGGVPPCTPGGDWRGCPDF